jgi:hypothetical protein
MAGDPLAKVSPGDAFRIPAEAYNAFVDAANAKRGGLPPQVIRDWPSSPIIVQVKNITGVALDRFSVVVLGNPVFDADDNLDEFKNNIVFKVTAPGDPADRPTVAVLTTALASDSIGRAVVMGEVAVKVDVSTGQEAWKYAKCITSTTSKLAMSETPACAIVLWKQSGTGEKWAKVLVHEDLPSSGTSARWAIATDGFTAGVSTNPHTVPVQICDDDGTSPSGSDITVYFENNPTRYPNVEEDDILHIVWNDAESQWICPIQDEPVGAIKLIDAGVSIPHGWENLVSVYPNSAGRFILCDATGDASYEGVQDDHSPDYSITIYPGGTTSVTGGGCWNYALANDNTGFPGRAVTAGFLNPSDINTAKKCLTEKIPEYVITDARPPWIKFRYIIRIDNGT